MLIPSDFKCYKVELLQTVTELPKDHDTLITSPTTRTDKSEKAFDTVSTLADDWWQFSLIPPSITVKTIVQRRCRAILCINRVSTVSFSALTLPFKVLTTPFVQPPHLSTTFGDASHVLLWGRVLDTGGSRSTTMHLTSTTESNAFDSLWVSNMSKLKSWTVFFLHTGLHIIIVNDCFSIYLSLIRKSCGFFFIF